MGKQTLFNPQKPDHISYSQIMTYTRCPQLWALEKLMGYRQPQTDPLKYGIALHEALARYTREYVKVGGHSVQVVNDIWSSVAGDPKICEPLDDKLYRNGLTLLESIVVEGRLDLSNVLFVEYTFRTMLDDVPLVGRIDRIDDLGGGIYRLVDYKTGMFFPSQEYVDEDLELSVFAMAWRELTGEMDYPVLVGYHNVSNGVYLESTRSREQMDSTRQFVIDTWRRLQADEEFVQSKGDACLMYGGCWASALCFAHNLCKIEQYELADITDSDVMDLYVLMETWLPRIRKLIRERTKVQDNISDGSREVVLKPRVRKIPKREVYNEFLEIFGDFDTEILDNMHLDQKSMSNIKSSIVMSIHESDLSVDDKAEYINTLETLCEQMFEQKETTPAISIQEI